MHANVQRALNFILALFLLVALWLVYWGAMRGPELEAREDNPRRVMAEQQTQRGQILDRSGRPLAWSEVEAEGTVKRRYAGDWLAHAVGYYSLHHGVGGAEAAFDEALRGETGLSGWEAWRDDLLHRPRIGQSVQLTLDADLQQAAGRALGDRRGAVVLLGAQSGQVLALASHPTFDPNTLSEDWDALREAPGEPLFNRATQGLYPPGNTFQPVIMVAALEEGLTTPDERFVDQDGREQFGDVLVRCATHPGLVEMDLLHAAAYGCNVAFARLSLRLGGERLENYAGRFGIGLAPGLEIPAQSGQLRGSDPWNDEALVLASLGQGEVLVSPLQMALVAAAIANEGAMPWPTLQPDRAVPARRVVAPETARVVRQAMALAVQEGPAKEAALASVTVAGVVGTVEAGAEVAPHAWFVGFAPAGPDETPRYAIAVVVEQGGEGSEAAAPVAVQVLALAAAPR
jgi:peptidoglycan glycosyltransferase